MGPNVNNECVVEKCHKVSLRVGGAFGGKESASVRVALPVAVAAYKYVQLIIIIIIIFAYKV